jgi:hypothetical protein
MIRLLSLSLLLSLNAAGCKKDDKPAGDQPSGATSPGDALTIAAAKISLQHPNPQPDDPRVLELTASGELKADDKTIARLSKDGRLVDPDGRLLASIDADGKVTLEGETETMVIEPDGSIRKDGTLLAGFGPDGALTGGLASEMGEGKAVYSGPPETRRAMMFAFLSASVGEPEGSVEGRSDEQAGDEGEEAGDQE